MAINDKIKPFLVLVLFFAIFFMAHWSINGLATADDPYYHAKHAFLMEQSGQFNLVRPWLEFHFFNYAPTDIWWGYHLGAAFFIHWFGLLLGIKVFASFLAALVFAVFYLILNSLKVKYPFIWVFFLLVSSTVFSFRLSLERPHLLSIIVLPLAFLFLAKGRNFWLFILSLFYTLSYHLAPLIILQTLVYSAVEAYTKKRINLRPLIASAGGILAGALIHPQSLNYFYIMFITHSQILFLKFFGVDLNIGSELQMPGFADFIRSNFLVLLAGILATVLFLSLKKLGKTSVVGNFLFLYSNTWLIVSLLVWRGVEYWLPITFLFAAVTFSDFMAREEFKQVKKWLANKIKFKILSFFLFGALTAVIFYNLSTVFLDFFQAGTETAGLSENYSQANEWLKANTKKDSVIFYSSWSMWPMMFFYNDYNHYITGIDPTFLYEYDQRTYWLWRNISYDGLYCDQPTPCLNLKPAEQIKLVPLAIKRDFLAKYAVVLNDEASNLIRTLNNLRAEVKLVFKNKDLLIYEIK